MIMIATSVQSSLHPQVFRSAIRGAINSITSSVMEMHISSGCWHKKFVRHVQRATLVGLQRNFLRQHDVACDEITFGRKAPSNTWTAGAIELDGAGCPCIGWCFAPKGYLVAGDVMLAQKIALETDERGALNVANKFFVPTTRRNMHLHY